MVLSFRFPFGFLSLGESLAGTGLTDLLVETITIYPTDKVKILNTNIANSIILSDSWVVSI